jgi:cytochrome c
MKSTKSILLPVAIALLAAATPAAANLELAKAKGCTACHDVGKKVVGPGYNEVAKKYKAAADGPATMANSIVKGSTGKWGPIPMPPNKVTEDEAKKLAAWILTL